MITATRRRLLAGLLVAAFVITACTRDSSESGETTLAPQPTVTIAPDDPIVTVDGVTVDGVVAADTPRLGVELSDGSPAAGPDADAAVATGEPLSDEEVAAVVETLPEWTDDPADESEFERPPETVLPPEVGETIDEPFPPDAEQPPPAGEPRGPLEVLRFQPEGDVDLAPFVTATFSEPMVPVATLEQLDEADAPMSIEPAVDGRWRWIGTRTLRFEAVPGEIDRLPDATSYEVTIPAGTESSNGAVLAESVSWNFATPTVELVQLHGTSDSMPTDPVWVAEFNQLVDPESVLEAITTTASGNPVGLRLAGADDLERDDDARRAVDAALDGRVVAFTPADELPVDSAIVIEIGPNVPSAEGPLTSPTVERFTGRTFGALRVARTQCGWDDDCVPGAPFVIELSNRLDPELFGVDSVAVSPTIPGVHIDVHGNTIEIRGATRGQTTYAVTLDGELADVYGQRLGDDTTVEFDVGSAHPALIGLQREFITTDPGAERATVSITTINHDAVGVRAWAVTPAQLTEFYEYLEQLWSDEDAAVPDWPEVLATDVEIDDVEDTFVETAIDLTDAFADSVGELVVQVDPLIDLAADDERYWENRPTVAWVQRTTLGVDAILDDDKLVIATNDLVTGAPVEGVPVELLGDGRVATTGDGGLVELDLGTDETIGLFANAGDRTALLPAERWGGWQAQPDSTDSRWYVFDDRGVYRPGETVHITGWVRRFEWSDESRLTLYPEEVTLEYRAFDAQGAEIAEGTTDLSAVGGFSIDLELPAGANTGPAWIEMTLVGADGDTSYQHSFQVQEFRRPQFEVTTRAETPPPYYDTEPTTVAVDATYFSGAPLPDAEVNWLVTTRETQFSPPGWDEFSFGIWQPWWYADDIGAGVGLAADVAVDVAEPDIECPGCPPTGEVDYEEFSGRTDASGSHFLHVDFDGDDVDLPSTVTAEATVFDVNRQAWASRTDLLVHPAHYYVGLRTDRNFVEPGTPIRVDAVVTDVDGEITAGRPIEMTAGRVEWGYTDGTWSEELVDSQSCTVESAGVVDDESMRCEFDTETGGTYRITATVTDEAGQASRTEITQWVSGGPGRPVRNVEQERVTIVPDRETYEPGDTAELLVQAPFAPAYGVVTIIHHGIVRSEAFDAESGSAVLEIPIEDAYVPNISVQVDMNGSTTRTDDDGTPRDDLPPRTAYATGTIDLPVPPVTRALDVTVEPADAALEPGEETSVTVAVGDADGEPVEGAEVAIVVVDEAVLALTNFELVDPLDVVYADLWSTVRSRYFRSTVMLESPDEIQSGQPTGASDGGDDAAEEAASEPADAAADDSGGGAAGRNVADDPILLRSDFDPVAVYAPGRATRADGTVTVEVALPDNLTRYRVMAVAVSGAEQFGAGEATITTRLPLMVRPSAPRFLNYGDRFELPVVLQNQSDEALDVDIAVETSNLALIDGRGRRVTVPANDRVEVRFPAHTTEAGTARVRIVAVGDSFSDATTFSLPVYTPATSEAFATYGVIDGETAVLQPVTAPESVIPAFGGFEIGTSSTALQALTDSMLYLVDDRFESSDAYASRIIAISSLREVLDAFDAEGLPPPAELDAKVASDITRLSALQNDDGGFPFWQRGRQSIPWNSILATHALVLADEAGYTVSASTLDAALTFVAAIEEHTPADYSQDLKWTLSAYALYVRHLAGRTDSGKAESLYETAGDELEPDALAWIWPSVVDPDMRAAIETDIANRAVDTPGGATFATEYDEDAYVIAQSDTRTDGVILDALITQVPESDLIPKVVNGLLGRRTNGRWNNDQENSFVLVAMKRYFDTFEATDPAFVARAWIDETYVAEVPFQGRSTERANTVVPMADLIQLTTPPADDEGGGSGGDGGGGDGGGGGGGDAGAADTASVTLAKDGEGRLYYRLGLTYAPSDLQLDARDEGFIVERTYLPVDDDGDVTRDENGNWHIRAGATVRVQLTMVADARRTHVALVDHLPAGLEPINPDLAVSQTIRPPDEPAEDSDEPAPYFWWWNWFEHQNLRDDRAEAFATYLDGGTYEYTYVTRATTPGTFVTPPATAEEIYSPEVFGRTATDVVVVE